MDKKSRFGGKGRQGKISDLINSNLGVNPAPPTPTSQLRPPRNGREISARRDRQILQSADKAEVQSSVNRAIGSDAALRHRNRLIY